MSLPSLHKLILVGLCLFLINWLCASTAILNSGHEELSESEIEWLLGDGPIVISIPHGGTSRPKRIATRTYGQTVRDGQTIELGLALASAIEARSGKRPHVVVCNLHRSKLDANRDVEEAAQHDPIAEAAWCKYHELIQEACAAVEERYGAGLYIDLHGQSHAQDWIEWGYAVSGKTLDRGELSEGSSIAGLAERSPCELMELVRGASSLGARAQQLGYKSVPSPEHPSPRGKSYFSGGYSVQRHGSRNGGNVDGVQLELPRSLRMNRTQHKELARDLAHVLVGFVNEHYASELLEAE